MIAGTTIASYRLLEQLRQTAMEHYFKKILLVLPQSDEAYDSGSDLIGRAVAVAETFKSDLHIFQSLQTEPVLQSAFHATPDSAQVHVQFAAHERERVANLTGELQRQHPNINISGDVIQGLPRSNAILECAKQIEATLIMKASREEKFLLGILSNTDWDLLRDAAIPVWLVQPPSNPTSGIVVALELEVDESAELALDQRVFNVARTLSEKLGSALYTVHAYELPTHDDFMGYAPIYPGEMVDARTIDKLHDAAERDADRVAHKHGQLIADFLTQQNLALDDVVVAEGYAPDLIKQEAEKHQAGLIVMGASPDKGRWDRLTRNVTAEVTLDNAPCDILFAR